VWSPRLNPRQAPTLAAIVMVKSRAKPAAFINTLQNQLRAINEY
jgi:hypothetical protein